MSDRLEEIVVLRERDEDDTPSYVVGLADNTIVVYDVS